jgi:lipoate-protein ligase B
MACDICGKTGTQLCNLRESYQTQDVKQVCEDCREDLDKQLSRIKGVTTNIVIDWMKRFITNRKEKP